MLETLPRFYEDPAYYRSAYSLNPAIFSGIVTRFYSGSRSPGVFSDGLLVRVRELSTGQTQSRRYGINLTASMTGLLTTELS